jgi:hypothetical protein
VFVACGERAEVDEHVPDCSDTLVWFEGVQAGVCDRLSGRSQLREQLGAAAGVAEPLQD